MAILDVFPTVPGHALLIPKGEYTTLDEMPPSVAGAFMADLPRLVKAVTVRGQERQCGGGDACGGWLLRTGAGCR